MMPLMAGAIRLMSSRPLLFPHVLQGHRTRLFTLLTVRAVQAEHTRGGTLLPDSERPTRLRRVLRGLTLDALPQLWAVPPGALELCRSPPTACWTPSQYQASMLK